MEATNKPQIFVGKPPIATVRVSNRSNEKRVFELFSKRNGFNFLSACYDGCPECDVTIKINYYVQPYIDFFETILSTALMIENITCEDDAPIQVFIKKLEAGRVLYAYKDKRLVLDGEQTIFKISLAPNTVFEFSFELVARQQDGMQMERINCI